MHEGVQGWFSMRVFLVQGFLSKFSLGGYSDTFSLEAMIQLHC